MWERVLYCSCMHDTNHVAAMWQMSCDWIKWCKNTSNIQENKDLMRSVGFDVYDPLSTASGQKKRSFFVKDLGHDECSPLRTYVCHVGTIKMTNHCTEMRYLKAVKPHSHPDLWSLLNGTNSWNHTLDQLIDKTKRIWFCQLSQKLSIAWALKQNMRFIRLRAHAMRSSANTKLRLQGLMHEKVGWFPPGQVPLTEISTNVMAITQLL